MVIADIIIAAIVIVVIVFVAKIVLEMIPLPPQIVQLVWLVIGIIVLFIILSWFGFGGDILNRRVGQ